jgi:hypothetical protein
MSRPSLRLEMSSRVDLKPQRNYAEKPDRFQYIGSVHISKLEGGIEFHPFTRFEIKCG